MKERVIFVGIIGLVLMIIIGFRIGLAVKGEFFSKFDKGISSSSLRSEEVVKNFLDAVIKGSFEKARQFLDTSKWDKFIWFDWKELTSIDRDILNGISNRLTYKIISVFEKKIKQKWL